MWRSGRARRARTARRTPIVGRGRDRSTTGSIHGTTCTVRGSGSGSMASMDGSRDGSVDMADLPARDGSGFEGRRHAHGCRGWREWETAAVGETGAMDVDTLHDEIERVARRGSPRPSGSPCSPAPASRPTPASPTSAGPNGVWTKNPAAEKTATLQHYLADPEVRRIGVANRLTIAGVGCRSRTSGTGRSSSSSDSGKLHAVVTQNVDGLHQKAGTDPEQGRSRCTARSGGPVLGRAATAGRWPRRWTACEPARTTRRAVRRAAGS